MDFAESRTVRTASGNLSTTIDKTNSVSRSSNSQHLVETSASEKLFRDGIDAPLDLANTVIMLVDDEPTVIDIVQMYLEDVGYKNFVTTSDSPAAMPMMEKTPPDLLLLDLMMPELDGFELLSLIRNDRKLSRIPVIVLTSSTDSETKLRALELGANDFLAKPVDESELVLRVRNNLAAKVYQDRLIYFDALTGLPNRRMFLERLDAALGPLHDNGTNSAILHIGLDRFKQINDVMGHGTGDRLLKLIAYRLSQSVRETDCVTQTDLLDTNVDLARMGGDEFTGLLTNLDDGQSATLVAGRLIACLAEPFLIDGDEFFVTASVGVALSPEHGRDVSTLLKHADIAMSHAKRNGSNNYQIYSDTINAQSVKRLSLENHLRKVLDRDQLRLHYQPKVSVSTGTLAGAEALIRWEHPELGLISPGEFIPLAEETGLIVPIGEWVIQTACQQCQQWRSQYAEGLKISVNVSTPQFRRQGLVSSVQTALAQSQLPGSHLVIELTESIIMENPERNVQILHELKRGGVMLSVDDFGTGYSSLSYLKRFPLDELKVDRSFIKDIPEDADDMAIVTAILAMASSLGLSVVAEGVEEEAQLAFLRELGCDEYQGFLFSKPLPVDEFTTLLQRVGPQAEQSGGVLQHTA